MRIATEVVELLVKSAGTWLFEGHQFGLSDREWMALRFLARANRFSRTPSALAIFLGTTRSGTSEIAAQLRKKGLVIPEPSAQDRRSVTLSVTAQGKKFLDRDPINALRDRIEALTIDDRSQLRRSLRQVLVQDDAAGRQHNTDICSGCMFLVEDGAGGERQFKCRSFRKAIAPKDTTLLCTYFERRSPRDLVAEIA
jgi:MarR family transcriptional regulator, negative regulator of the multidrug operon emrRAB